MSMSGMSPIEHVWDALDRRIRQRVPVPANIQQLRTAIEEEWTNIPQATINNLINSMRRRWEMVVTPDNDWFSVVKNGGKKNTNTSFSNLFAIQSICFIFIYYTIKKIKNLLHILRKAN